MPKRNEEQRIKRNETRRNLKKLSRKAIFCLDHLRITRPDMHKKASELYEYINSIYPHKHNLTKTALYQRTIQNINVKEQVLKHAELRRNTGQSREINPRLEIPLISLTTSDQAKETSQQQTTVTDSQPPNITEEEMDAIIRDLQQEPDLKGFFNEIEACGPEARPKTLEEEINDIIQQEFQTLGAELQDLINPDELTC